MRLVIITIAAVLTASPALSYEEWDRQALGSEPKIEAFCAAVGEHFSGYEGCLDQQHEAMNALLRNLSDQWSYFNYCGNPDQLPNYVKMTACMYEHFADQRQQLTEEYRNKFKAEAP